MTDLHEGRGPKRNRTAAVLLAAAIALFCCSFFVEGLDGPKWLEMGLRGASIISVFAGVCRQVLHDRTCRRRRADTDAMR